MISIPKSRSELLFEIKIFLLPPPATIVDLFIKFQMQKDSGLYLYLFALRPVATGAGTWGLLGNPDPPKKLGSVKMGSSV